MLLIPFQEPDYLSSYCSGQFQKIEQTIHTHKFSVTRYHLDHLAIVKRWRHDSDTAIPEFGHYCGIWTSSEYSAACETLRYHEKGAGLGERLTHIP
jgi:hypothetical protein